MAITGKYYMHYGQECLLPQEPGRENTGLMAKKLMLDNLRIYRFHRVQAENLIPDIYESQMITLD